MGHSGVRTPRDLSRWIAPRAAGPPLILGVLFWGTVAVVLAVNAYATSLAPGFVPAGWPLPDALYYLVPSALAAACLLWPRIAWSRSAPPVRKAASCGFLAAALGVMLNGQLVGLLMPALAIGNAAVVFGVAGGLAYAACAWAVTLAVSLANPAQRVPSALLDSALVLLLCLFMLLAAAALAAAWQRSERTRRLLADLEDAHAELRRYAERTRELAVAEERARMARDMHDSVGHYLTVVNMSLANAQRFRDTRPEEAWREVADAQRLTRDALADTRQWVRALNPLRMRGRSGVEAMRALAESFTGRGTAIGFTSRGDWPETAEETGLICYRTLQEAVTNALRHSGADRIDAVAECSGTAVELRVSDNGRGARGAAEGFGLGGLRERVETAGGSLAARDRAEGGFEVVARLPVQSPAALGADAEAETA
ncbi:sensor histidine kinase [Streptomonospora litoralis]|uniref:histidine kinase n=1 Tax=Streptomonospora litoralis TaxID=2498135 RepID=A0A4P6Q4L0_9ACTN|nr:sensor histidine kinase [Streptomonospora litoralis]QBI55200.1 Sensor histidine kinase DesK [Streptomonospora litoralis]